MGLGSRSRKGPSLSLAVLTSAAAGVITYLVALISAVPSGVEPPEGVALGNALLHMSTLTAVLGMPLAVVAVVIIGFPVYYWARRTGRSGIGPFLSSGMIGGMVAIPLLWLAVFGVFDTVLIVVGAMGGGVSAAVFWACLRSGLAGAEG